MSEPGGKGKEITSPRMMRAFERQRMALMMRISGASYPDIARACEYRGKSGAWKAVNAAMKSHRRAAGEEVRELEIMRLDSYLTALKRKIAVGSEEAIRVALQVAKRRADLLGLDEPTRIEMTIEEKKRIVVEELIINLTPDKQLEMRRLLFGGDGTPKLGE